MPPSRMKMITVSILKNEHEHEAGTSRNEHERHNAIVILLYWYTVVLHNISFLSSVKFYINPLALRARSPNFML